MPSDQPFLGFVQLVGWPDVRRGPWFVAAHWAEVAGRPECVGLELWKGVRPEPHAVSSYSRVKGVPLEGIASTDLKALPVATILATLWDLQRRQVEAQVQGAREHLVEDLPESTRRLWELVADQERSSPFQGEHRPRRRHDDRDHFAEVAETYRRAHQDRRPPTKAVAHHFSVSHSTASKWVARARELKLLGQTRPGKAGGITSTNRRRRP